MGTTPPTDPFDRERHEIEQVHDRLIQDFSGVPASKVHAIVDEVHAGMTGRIRDFVPVLVERECRDRLRALNREEIQG